MNLKLATQTGTLLCTFRVALLYSSNSFADLLYEYHSFADRLYEYRMVVRACIDRTDGERGQLLFLKDCWDGFVACAIEGYRIDIGTMYLPFLGQSR